MRSSCKLIGLIATLVAPALLSAQTYPSTADPRSNLKPGRFDAGDGGEQHAPRVVLAEAGAVRLGARPDVHQLRRGVRHATTRTRATSPVSRFGT